jgi:hypothetical protein
MRVRATPSLECKNETEAPAKEIANSNVLLL